MIPNGVFKNIVGQIRKECRQRGVTVRLYPSKRYLIDGEVGGEAYFDSDHKLVCVATKGHNNAEILMALIHEFCHVLQWYEKQPCWTNCQIRLRDRTKMDASQIMADHVDGTSQLSYPYIKKAAEALYTVEAFAEWFTVFYAREFGLHDFIDLNLYTKEANAYLLTYVYTLFYRKWIPANRPLHKVLAFIRTLPDQIQFEFPSELGIRAIAWHIHDTLK